MEFRQGVGYLSHFTTDVVADNVQYLEPRAQQGSQSQPQQSSNQHSQQQNQPPQQQYSGDVGRGQQPQYGHNHNPIEVSDDDLPF